MADPLDHHEFIARQEPASPIAKRQSRRAVLFDVMLSLFYLFVYCGILIGLSLALEVDRFTVLLGGLLFIIVGILTYWAHRLSEKWRGRERERLLIREVMEVSRGARLITNGADETVFYNRNFEQLCESLDDLAPGIDPGLEKVAALFGRDSVTGSVLTRMGAQARAGERNTIPVQAGHGIQERWYQITAQPVPGWQGYIHWRFDDITHERDMQRAVQREREKLIDFTDNAPVGFFSVNEEGRFMFVNATFARWLGEDIDRLLSHGHLHTYLERPPLNAAPYDILDGGGAKQITELVMKGPGGKTFQAAINQTVVREDDRIIRTRGVVHDLTHERDMRRALKASEDKFQRFFEEAPLGIVMIDLAGAIEDYNTVFENLIAGNGRNVGGHDMNDFVKEEDRSAFKDALNHLKPGRRMTAPVEIKLKPFGTDHTVAVQMHARRFKENDSIVLHFIDLTEQKNLEAQFTQSQKMQAVGQLAGGIAHDFNNLLTAIIGFCDLLLLRHKPGDPSFTDIMQIKQNSNRAANLVRQLLAFSRQQTLRPQLHDLSEILTELSHLIRRLIGANIELEVSHGDDLGLVKVDAGQMEQVLINLAVNARDAMADGGTLSIKTENFDNEASFYCGDDEMPPGSWVCITVRDTGTGIPDDILSRILEPFFTTKGVGEGTGLGLATVYGIVRQTGGYLCIDTKEGEGTAFIIYLPRVEPDIEAPREAPAIAKEEKAPTKPTDLTGSACILLVEDEDAVRTFSQRALINKGYDVITAENGADALEVLAAHDGQAIDLLITDVMMPDMDGPTLAKTMRESHADLSIIFISGYTEDKLKDHMDDKITFLPKPFTLKQLAEKVKDSLSSS